MSKFIFYLLIPTFFMACGDAGPKTDWFDIAIEGKTINFQKDDAIGVSILNKKEKEIKSVTYSIDGKDLAVTDGKIVLDVTALGTKTINAKINFDDDDTVTISKAVKVFAKKAPEVYTYEIVNTYPHDNNSYTQGLEFHRDTLYEGTGHKGKSYLRRYTYEDGNVIDQVDLEDTFFGEGITILNDKIYQLTWQASTGFIYNLKDLKKIDSFKYGESKEGWGLANDGKKLFKSDGTEKIWFLNPETLVEEGYIETVTNSAAKKSANELEYVNGKIYANVYQYPSVMIIDATSGAIEGVVNFKGLEKEITKKEKWDDKNNVLNGIAYHPERKTFFVTGKDWDKLFEVNIIKK